jgi:hypothetical protein
MELANIDTTEIKAVTVYLVPCFMCEKELYVTADCNIGDVAHRAAAQGWHSYQTADETCSIACPTCIAEVTENELEMNS